MQQINQGFPYRGGNPPPQIFSSPSKFFEKTCPPPNPPPPVDTEKFGGGSPPVNFFVPSLSYLYCDSYTFENISFREIYMMTLLGNSFDTREKCYTPR